MNLLLDTHTLLWWLGNHPTLSRHAREVVRDINNCVYVSAATGWEIAIKKTLGKLDAPENLEETLSANNFLELPISIAHSWAAGKLPGHHNDPFDRMLIAQALLENLTLITRDSNIAKYGVKIIDA